LEEMKKSDAVATASAAFDSTCSLPNLLRQE
jgi:hypothetical protein